MPYLIQRRVRTSQPQQAVGVKSAWIEKGLYTATYGDFGDVVNPPPRALPADTAITVGATGRLLSQAVAGSASTGINFPKLVLSARTELFIQECSSRRSYGRWIGYGNIDCIRGEYTDTGFEWFIHGDVWGSSENVFSGTSPVTLVGLPRVILVKWSKDLASGYGRAFIDGLEIARAGGSPLTSVSNRTLSTAQDYIGTNQNVSGVGLFIAFSTYLSDEDTFSLLYNPWQIFEDEEDYIWVPDVVGGYTATGAVSGSGSIVTGAATKTQVYSGSGAVAGTGATVTGAATRSFDSTGTVAGSGAIVTGSATNTQPSITSTGVVTGQGAIVSGAATRQFSSTGTVAGQGATVTGAATKTQVYSSTGAVVGGGAVVAGTATNTPLGISAYGDVAGQGSIVSGVATRAFLSTGAVVGAVATVTGSATRTFTATGAIAGYTAVITGAATNTPLGINGYGSVSGQGASVSGTATVTAVFTATGAVVGAGATITGYATNVRVVTSSGAISGQGATVAGAATVSGITVWPLASDVRRGVVYGPNGIDYTGTLSVGTGTGGGMNVTLSEPRLSVVSRDNSVYVFLSRVVKL